MSQWWLGIPFGATAGFILGAFAEGWFGRRERRKILRDVNGAPVFRERCASPRYRPPRRRDGG